MSTLQVNEITDTGGSTLLGRRNAIINGNFDVWQRGTSQTAAGYGSADRWNYLINESTQSVTRESFAVGQTDVPNNPKYFSRNVVTTAGTASSYILQQHKVEGVETFAGETVTLSFWAKADSAKSIVVEFVQEFGSGGSPSASVFAIGVTTIPLTTGWQKHTVTASIPSISGKTIGTNSDDCLTAEFWLDAGSTYNARTNSLGNQSGTFEFAQVQLEAGSVATPFERRSYGEELALCQRYYLETQTYRSGYIVQGTAGVESTPFPVNMRATPTLNVLTTDALINCTGVSVVQDDNQGFRHHPSGGTSNIATRYRVSISADAEL